MRKTPGTSPQGRRMGKLGAPGREVSTPAPESEGLDRGSASRPKLHHQRDGSTLRHAPGDHWDAGAMGIPDASGGRQGGGNAGQAEASSTLFRGGRMTLDQLDDFAREICR